MSGWLRRPPGARADHPPLPRPPLGAGARPRWPGWPTVDEPGALDAAPSPATIAADAARPSRSQSAARGRRAPEPRPGRMPPRPAATPEPIAEPGAAERPGGDVRRCLRGVADWSAASRASACDLGCGEGELVGALLAEAAVHRGRRRWTSRHRALELAARRLQAGPDARAAAGRGSTLFQGVAHLPRRAARRLSTRPCSWRSSSTSTRPGWPRWSASCSAHARPGTSS